ncbi:DUF4328 domain-containing protein [Jiangella ureilytica]|uniref:DUF4328 domain-containing protein n=1 Tax=Jiangella ureilytica TaxID=2530374 RepID=A0A4R4RK94_9ACTN|nr:DUF4328 domain-containing protein [Jiangella ureilytica]TDC49920.1 DUF4328 domain-containing protein [Jiangella ureilytica]
MSFYDQPDHGQGGVAWAAPPAPESTSLSGLRTALTVLLGVAALIGLVTVVASGVRIRVVGDFIAGSADVERLDAADDLVVISGWLWILIVLAIAPVFIVWQYRHARNARVLGSTSWGPGWAIGGWFIPIANFVLPVRQLWVASKFSDPRQNGAGIVIAWGITWAITTTVSRAAGRQETNTLEDFRSMDTTSLVGGVLGIAAAGLAILMVRELTRKQETMLSERLALLGRPAQAAWPPPYGRQPSPAWQPHAGPAPYPTPPVNPVTPPAGPSPFAPRPDTAPGNPGAPRTPPAPPPVPPSSTP